MMMAWLRDNVYAAGLLTLVRIYLGWQWLTAGWHKITDNQPFKAAGFLQNAIDKPIVDKATGELVYPTYTAFLEHVALPNVNAINILIPWGEFLVGLGLLLGALTGAAAFFGVLMNLMFMFAGTVSTNPWLMLLGIIVMAGGANAGKFGLDYYALPNLRNLLGRMANKGRRNKLGGPNPLHR